MSAFRLARRYTAMLIWRLRNRLIVAYVFIAVVPILLIVVLVASATYVITGQAAVYLITSELDRRNELLAAAAEHPENLDRLLPFLRTRFPDVQVASSPGYPEDRRADSKRMAGCTAGRMRSVTGTMSRCWRR